MVVGSDEIFWWELTLFNFFFPFNITGVVTSSSFDSSASKSIIPPLLCWCLKRAAICFCKVNRFSSSSKFLAFSRSIGGAAFPKLSTSTEITSLHTGQRC